MMIRDAGDADLTALTDLYNSWIPTRTITWTENLATYEERARWLSFQRDEGFPVLVADEDGRVVGYAAYGHFRGEGKVPGYGLTVEHTVHVHPEHWGCGVGRALMDGLTERARAAGIHAMVGAIDGDNDASIGFHERLGFVEVARMPEVGHKFGRWLDLVLMQRLLDSRPQP